MTKWGVTCFFEKREDFAKILEIVPHYPVQYLEIRGERPFFAPEDLTETGLAFFQEIIEKSGLSVTMHATFYDINLATINSYLKRATVTCYQKYLDLASEIGAEVLVLHAGQIHKDAASNKKIQEIAERNLIENLRILGDYAREREVTIGLENSPPNPHSLMVWEPHRHIELLEKTNHPAVKAVLDMAHAYLHGHDISHYFQMIEPYLCELHIHNNDGKGDQHRAISMGTIDYAGFFRENTVSVPVIMEVHNIEEALQSLEWIKEFHDE